MNGEVVTCGRFANQLRRRLWSIHLGVPLESEDLDDPIHSRCYNDLWLARGRENVRHYFECFSLLPNNSIREMIDVHKMLLPSDHPMKQSAPLSLYQTYFLDNLCPLNRDSFLLCSCCLFVDRNPVAVWTSCIKCLQMFCPYCLKDMKCHECQRLPKCPVKNAPQNEEGSHRIAAAQYLKECIRGNVCCYPTEYLKDCDLDDAVLSKVVGRHVFQ
jgi:hypothetical protein